MLPRRGGEVRRCTLRFPKHVFRPKELMGFLELRVFTSEWSQMGFDDDDLNALQVCIMMAPTAAPVVPGTGSLRKMRFASSRSGRGKRGAARVCYVYFEECLMVVLVHVYAKNQKDDLSEGERRSIKAMIEKLGRSLETNTIR